MSKCKRDGCNFNEYRDCRGYCSPYCQDLADKDAEITRLAAERDAMVCAVETRDAEIARLRDDVKMLEEALHEDGVAALQTEIARLQEKNELFQIQRARVYNALVSLFPVGEEHGNPAMDATNPEAMAATIRRCHDAEIARLREENERLRPVYEAALRWHDEWDQCHVRGALKASDELMLVCKTAKEDKA